MSYDDIRKEIVEELRGYGIKFNFEESSLDDSEAAVQMGKGLSRYVDRMVEKALIRIGHHQHHAELGKSLERIATLLADRKISITIKETKDGS